jgi:type II secretory pathway component PulC
MSKRLWLFNLLLVLIFLFLLVKVYEVWTDSKSTGWERSVPGQKAQPPPPSGTVAGKGEMFAPNRYQSISDKNLFNPERKEFSSTGVSGDKTGLSRLDLVLYGIVIGGEYHSAIITNPEKRVGKGQRDTITVKIGDKVAGYQVTKILEDRITLESNGETQDLLLYDPSRPKKRSTVTSPPKPAPTPATPARPVPLPGPGAPQPQPPVPVPPGISQAPLPLPPGREVPRRIVPRPRTGQPGNVPPASGSVVSPDKEGAGGN